jgi:hypothetical protein
MREELNEHTQRLRGGFLMSFEEKEINFLNVKIENDLKIKNLKFNFFKKNLKIEIYKVLF